MAFTSYVSALEAQEYIDVFHNGAVVEDADLIRASYTLDRIYRDRFVGAKTDIDQEHEWPRNGDVEVPESVIQAVIEIAIAVQSGAFDPYSVTPGVLSKTVTVGDISQSTSFKPSTVFETNSLGSIDLILGGLITPDVNRGGISFARIAKTY